jgi:hypothetical protein
VLNLGYLVWRPLLARGRLQIEARTGEEMLDENTEFTKMLHALCDKGQALAETAH